MILNVSISSSHLFLFCFFSCTCCPLLNNHFPHFHIYNVNLDLATLRIFGTRCFVSTLQAHRTKFQSRVKKCIYLGHSSGAKGFLIFNLHTRELFVSRHVIVYETVFPYYRNMSSSTIDSIFPITLLDVNISPVVDVIPTLASPSTEVPLVTSSSIDDNSVPAHSSFSSPPIPPITPTVTAAPIPTGFSTRPKTTPKYLNAYKCTALNSMSNKIHTSGTIQLIL
ncbi:hypothetical protein P8452_08796 [Trifolium repens]|nr:hypothetical protein P8452_08796 [Trifolium repens]